MLPIDELKKLDFQVDNATELRTLKPIFYRVAEIARQNDTDFEVQIAAAELRQHIIDKGLALKQPALNGSPSAPKEAHASSSVPARLVVVELPPPTETGRPQPKLKPLNLRRAILIGAGLGIAAWLIIFVVLVQIARNHNMPAAPVAQGGAAGDHAAAAKAAPGTLPVDIATTPPGASIQINGETKCKSNCRVNLPPGNYQVTAILDGFDPGATGLTVAPGNPLNVSLNLVSQKHAVRLLTDLDGGKVTLDGQPAGELQDGQLVLDRVAAGKHVVRVVSKLGDAQFAFDCADGKQPVITAPVAATNMLAILVTSLGSQATILSSAQAPVQVALNGQPRGEAGPLGLELKDVPPGDQTLTVALGQDRRQLVVPFGPMPSLTAFLKADINTGILVVATGEDDVTVFVNEKPYSRKTKRGELRIKTVGNLAVRVAKPGFQPEPHQNVEIKKGEETRIAFRLIPLPKVAALQIRNGVPGTSISIDDGVAARVGPDGSFSASNITPGEHAIEARREGFITRRILRTLKAGETLAISGTEIALPVATASLRLVVSPPEATVIYRRGDEAQSHVAQDFTLKLDPGSYIFTARAPNYVDRAERATVAAGENRSLEIALAKESKPAPVIAPKPVAAVSWAGWANEDGEYVRKGGDRVTLRSGRLSGTITFTAHLRKAGGIFRGGKLRWFIEDGGYSQFEVDKKKFVARGPDGSRSKDRIRGRGADEDENTYTVQIDISPERIVHRIKVGESWITVDSQPARNIADARFGFVIPGSEEIGISNLHYAPR